MSTCTSCNKEFDGRSNRKFCSISCKNRYHNENNKEKEAKVLEINKILHRNWTTLHKLYDIYRSAPISMDVAQAYGYDNDYFTHIHSSPIGDKYTMIYDLGFKNHLDNKIQIIIPE
ncbi:MAG: hypothetical protein ACI857_000094 [Arenicella sp.]|jgi:hypothetical protein